MSVANVKSSYIFGLEATPVSVEVDVSSGIYSFSIVGLPDKAIDESKDRVISAIKNTGLLNPKKEGQKIIVSLSPAHIKKEGTHFDLPIAISYLLASKQISFDSKDKWFVGELSLNGDLQPMQGVLSIAECAKKNNIKELFVPEKNKLEASLVPGIKVFGCSSLKEVVKHFGGLVDAEEIDVFKIKETDTTEIIYKRPDFYLDFKDVRGQELAKKALEIAASGGHNIALYGPPGTGKTMLARAFSGILPPLLKDEIFEVNRIHSIASRASDLITSPPFRSPHHTSSYISLVGGGANPRPGEVTLAHRGVLFLDEFPEFDKRVIESLRQPLEEGNITVARAKGSFVFPASCIVIIAMNPCPCGYMGSKIKRCICRQSDIEKYARKLSGPIMDRIDMWVPVQHIDYNTLSDNKIGEGSLEIGKRVNNAREFAVERFNKIGKNIKSNKEISAKDINSYISLSENAKDLIKKLAIKYALSPRAYHRMLRVARTIADLDKKENINEEHILEAFQYRPKMYEN